MVHVYLIPGMGLDERLFFRLKINVPEIHYLQWLEPIGKENLQVYCQRMAAQIQHTENILLVGVSFGGIAAVEIAKIKKIDQVILISSIKTSAEKPAMLKLVRHIPLYKLTTPTLRQFFRKIWGRFFGLRSETAHKFFFDMFEKMSEDYKEWAIGAIAKWDNTTYPDNLIHLQGTRDFIFPIRYIKNPIAIKGGDHGMVVTKARDISKIINKVILNFR